ncbi:hypothetical protein M0802_005256 [Mischocyttarus mexicanus]|nr:hypothetical protein M0802_005256 [Mischocyttarus mexicanus]
MDVDMQYWIQGQSSSNAQKCLTHPRNISIISVKKKFLLRDEKLHNLCPFTLYTDVLSFYCCHNFFSKRGRQALVAYAFILTLTGPGKNVLRNINVLTESLVCGQEQLKEAVKSILDIIKEPFYALKDAIMKVVKAVRIIVSKIKKTFIAIKRLVLSIIKVITAVFQWLGSVVNICNKKLGTPFERCQRVFEGAVADCRAKLGPIFGGICDLTYIVSALCWIVKPLDFICMLVSYVADSIVAAVKKKIRKFTRHMKTMFYVKVKFSHSFHFVTNKTKSIHDIATDISGEIHSRTERFIAVFDWVNCLTAFFIFFMLLRVLHYRHKWLTSERFDNRYITNDIRTIDLIRARQDKETILPLNPRERNRYVSVSSIRLIKMEKIRLTKSVTFLCLSTMKICMHIMTDYSLYWILSLIRYHGRIDVQIDQPNSVGVYVSGTGFLAELYRSIVKAFTPHIEDIEISSVPCLPDPIPPNYDGYIRILSLIFFCWIMTICEPYCLRLRQVVMCQYHPDRAKQRAAWLYNHIMRSRGSFVKFARRQLRRKFSINGETIERITLKQRFLATIPFLKIFFPQREKCCLLCGAVQLDDSTHVKCPTPNCVGLYCMECFADLQNICTICQSPLEYGDLSDLSEEIDSSDDQLKIAHERKLKLAETERKKREEEKKIKEDESIVKERTKIEMKDVGEQTDEKEFEDSDQTSSSSTYSYTYQDDLTREPEIYERKLPFKDLEAQKIRDDVTIQIFNDPIARSVTLSSDTTPSCFVVRAHRKIRSRLKKRPRSLFPCEDSNSSTSITNSEYCSSEEIKEDEVIHIELNDGSRELLIQNKSEDGKSYNRVRRIIAALTNIPWIGRSGRKGLQPRRQSLIKRIIKMLNVKKSTSPVQTYRRISKKKNFQEITSSTSSLSDDDNDGSCLINNNQPKKCIRKARRTHRHVEWEDPEDIIYAKNYKKGKILCPSKVNDINWQYPCEKKFTTKDLPRHLEPISKCVSYYEIDETGDSQSSCKCVHKGNDINILSDTRTSSNSRKTDTWNIIGEDDTQRANKMKKNQDSMIIAKETEKISQKIENDTNESSNYDNKYLNTETDQIKIENEGGSKKKVKLTQFYDTLSNLELHGAEDKLKKRSDKKKNTILSRNKTVGKVDVGTGPLDYDKAVQTKIVKRRKKENNERKISDRTKKINHNLIRSTESKEQKWKKCIEEYKKRKRRTYDESHQFPEDNEREFIHERIYPKEIKKQLISGFIPIMYPENLLSYKPCYDLHERDHAKISKQEQTSDLERIFQPCSSRVYQRKPHDNRLRYYREKQFDSRQSEDDQTDDNRHQDYCYRLKNEHAEEVTTCTEDKTNSSESLSPVLERCKRDKHHCKQNMYHTAASLDKFHPPVIRKYLPMYQRSELIEELKEHDRIRLIREKEARRCVTSNPLEYRKLPFIGKMRKEQTLSEPFVDCEREKSINYPLPQVVKNDKLPYQETRAFKEVTKEFRRRTLSGKKDETIPLISQSRNADKSKEVKQLFPPNEKNRKSNFVSNITHRIVNALKPVHQTKYVRKNPEIHEMSSMVYEPAYRRHLSDVSSSPDDTTDNNDVICKILCHHPSKLSNLELEQVKQKEQTEQKGIQYSYTSLQQNINNNTNNQTKLSSSQSKNEPISTHQERATSIPVFNETQMSQELKLQLNDKQMEKMKDDSSSQRKEESKESISKVKKHYSEDACHSETCSNENCTSSSCNRVIDKKRVSEKEIDPSKITEMINSSIKEAMQTLIKQCAMDGKKSISLEEKYKERGKIDRSPGRKRQDTAMIRKCNEDNRCMQRTHHHPCDYSRKSEKRGTSIKSCKGRHVKDDLCEGSTISQCHNPQDTCRDKDKKDCKTAKNVKTDNRRMTGNVNIYICSEANENAQRKEKQKQKSQSCTESSSETTTERTDSTCARTSSVSSDNNKLVNNIQTRCPNLEEEHSDNSFSMREPPACVVDSNESNGNCCERKYDDSLEDLNMNDHLECSISSSKSTNVDSMISSISSTRDSCCCRDTASGYIDKHHSNLPCLKPRFTIYGEKLEGPCTATIYPRCPIDDDNWIQRSICTKEAERLRCHDSLSQSIDQRCDYYGDAFVCCCKKRPRFRSIRRRRSSFDILHAKGLCRKWSRCSCIIEENELEDQCTNMPVRHTICKNNFGNPNIDDHNETINYQDCKINRNTDDKNKSSMNNPGNKMKDEDTLEKNREIPNKTSSKSFENPAFQKRLKDLSRTQIETSAQKINPVIKYSATDDIIEIPKVTIVTRQQPLSQKSVPFSEKGSNSSVKHAPSNVDKNLPDGSSEISEEKGPKQKNPSEKKSKSSFLGRSFKRAINIVRQNKIQSANPGKDNPDDNPKDNRTNFPVVSKTIQPNKSEIETFSPKIKNVGNPGTLRRIEQKNEELESSKLIGNPNKRPKTKLQSILASKKTLKPVKEESKDTKQFENIQDKKGIKERLTDKDATGDFEENSTNKGVPSERKPENLGCMEDRYSYGEKCSKPMINRCCYCRLPVVDCTCEYRPPECECRPVLVDNCECDKPLTCDELCQTPDFYSRYDVLCLDCQKPRDKCCCNTNYIDHCVPNYEGPCNETMICVYCEYPRDKCICNAPIRKCSYCNLTFDICKCREFNIYDGRPIVTDCDGDQKICVTAWKPKSEVRQYFSRNFDAFPSDSPDECYCRKTHKVYGFNELPYQRLSVFSDVMSELQQKISDSVCCDRCKMTPCCCRGTSCSKNVENDERKGRCYVR